jgi:hypothetical protein
VDLEGREYIGLVNGGKDASIRFLNLVHVHLSDFLSSRLHSLKMMRSSSFGRWSREEGLDRLIPSVLIKSFISVMQNSGSV